MTLANVQESYNISQYLPDLGPDSLRASRLKTTPTHGSHPSCPGFTLKAAYNIRCNDRLSK